MTSPLATLHTIGYAPHTLEGFTALLRQHAITALADVRTLPRSAYKPEFNQDALRTHLKTLGIDYVFLGHELGARMDVPGVYVDGVADFERMAAHPRFLAGLDRLRAGMARYSVALMCAEKDPLTCHRTILICRALREEARIRHILADGRVEPHRAAEARLLRLFNLDQPEFPMAGMGRTEEQRLAEAYRKQAGQIASRLDSAEDSSQGDKPWPTPSFSPSDSPEKTPRSSSRP